MLFNHLYLALKWFLNDTKTQSCHHRATTPPNLINVN